MIRSRIDRWFAEFRENGDPRALARVFDGAAPELWRVAAYLCRDRHAAEDAVQSAFLTAIEARADWESSRPLIPWLLGVLVNRVREERRRAARGPEPERIVTPRADADPADAASRQELDDTLRSTLAKLAEPYRSTLEQHLVEERSPAEIAQRDGVAAGTVRMRLHRGLDRLRHLLPAGMAAPGLATLMLTPASMAAMRTRVLAAAGDGAVGAGVAVLATASSKGKKVAVVAALLLGAVTLALTIPEWAAPARPGSAPTAAASTSRDRAETDGDSAPAGAANERRRDTRDAVAAAPGGLRVRILSHGSLAPVRGAKLAVVRGDADVRDGETDDEGSVVFALPAGPARVEVREPSFDSADVTVKAGDTVEQVLLVSPPFPVDLRVVDAAGAAVPAARIVVRSANDGAAPDAPLGRTDGDGRWRGQLLLGAYVVRAHADGRASSGAALVNKRDASATLQVGGEPADLAGTVRDRDGEPVAGAGVVLQREPEDEWSAPDPCYVLRADDAGRYGADHLAPGSYTVLAFCGDEDERRYARASAVVAAAQPNIVDVTFDADAGIAVELVRPDGRPWGDAFFDAIAVEQPTRGVKVGYSGRTDEAGRLSVAGLPPGRYRVMATAEGEALRETVELLDGEDLPFRRVMGSAAWIEVQLSDAEGEPLSGWVVRPNDVFAASLERDSLWPRPPSVRTDDRGVARFEGVPDRPTWVTVSRAGVPTPIVIREVASGERTTIVLSPAQLAQANVIGQIRAHELGGVARLDASLIPLPDVPRPVPRGLEAAVDPDGSFAFEGVPPGSYGIMVVAIDAGGSQLGRVAWRRGITVSGTSDVDLGAIPVALGNVPVRLLRSDGAAVARPRLVSRLATGFPFQSCGQTVADGRIELEDVPAGSLDVLALGDDCAPKPARVAAPHSGRSVEIVVEPAATVTVRCESLPAESGKGSVRVLLAGRIWFSETVPDAQRGYRVGLPPGSYRIEFRPDDATRGACWAADFSVRDGAAEVVARRVD